MHWFLTMPNETDHPLHETQIRFDQVIGLLNGSIPSRLNQMSRIYKMMLRYSVSKANQFLLRFPQVYWAPDNAGRFEFYYHTISTDRAIDKKEDIVASWKIKEKRRVLLHTRPSAKKSFKNLQTGSEFTLYYDENAFFQKDVLQDKVLNKGTKYNTIQSSDTARLHKNSVMRQKLDMNYSWQQDAHAFQVNWMDDEFTRWLSPSIHLEKISNTLYELKQENQVVGHVMIMAYKIYVSYSAVRNKKLQMYIRDLEQLMVQASMKNIEITFINSM